MGTVLTIIIGVFLFSCMIFVHEFGHFFTAKLFKIQVNEFALGMGPRLFHFQRGETQYSLRLLPIGGFCAMEGEDEESTSERAFYRQKIWKRMIVIAAGGIMNVLFGLLLMFALQAQQDSFLSTTIVETGKAVHVQEGAFESGDKIISINGYRVFCEQDFRYAMARYNDEGMDFVVLRDGAKVTVSGVKIDYEGLTGKDAFAFVVEGVEKTFFSTIAQSFTQVIAISRTVYASLFDLLTGHYGLSDLSGPIGTVDAIGQVAASGTNFIESLNNVLWIMSLITVNLGLFNLLPVPALDGGRLFFLLIEAIRRKPIPPKYEGIVHMVGLILLFCLMIVVTFSDIMKLLN